MQHIDSKKPRNFGRLRGFFLISWSTIIMKQPVIQRQEISNFPQPKANHGAKSKEILSGLFFSFMLAALAYMFIVKQVDEIDQQAEFAAEYNAQFKDYPNERNH